MAAAILFIHAAHPSYVFTYFSSRPSYSLESCWHTGGKSSLAITNDNFPAAHPLQDHLERESLSSTDTNDYRLLGISSIAPLRDRGNVASEKQ